MFWRSKNLQIVSVLTAFFFIHSTFGESAYLLSSLAHGSVHHPSLTAEKAAANNFSLRSELRTRLFDLTDGVRSELRQTAQQEDLISIENLPAAMNVSELAQFVRSKLNTPGRKVFRVRSDNAQIIRSLADFGLTPLQVYFQPLLDMFRMPTAQSVIKSIESIYKSPLNDENGVIKIFFRSPVRFGDLTFKALIFVAADYERLSEKLRVSGSDASSEITANQNVIAAIHTALDQRKLTPASISYGLSDENALLQFLNQLGFEAAEIESAMNQIMTEAAYDQMSQVQRRLIDAKDMANTARAAALKREHSVATQKRIILNALNIVLGMKRFQRLVDASVAVEASNESVDRFLVQVTDQKSDSSIHFTIPSNLDPVGLAERLNAELQTLLGNVVQHDRSARRSFIKRVTIRLSAVAAMVLVFGGAYVSLSFQPWFYRNVISRFSNDPLPFSHYKNLNLHLLNEPSNGTIVSMDMTNAEKDQALQMKYDVKEIVWRDLEASAELHHVPLWESYIEYFLRNLLIGNQTFIAHSLHHNGRLSIGPIQFVTNTVVAPGAREEFMRHTLIDYDSFLSLPRELRIAFALNRIHFEMIRYPNSAFKSQTSDRYHRINLDLNLAMDQYIKENLTTNTNILVTRFLDANVPLPEDPQVAQVLRVQEVRKSPLNPMMLGPFIKNPDNHELLKKYALFTLQANYEGLRIMLEYVRMSIGGPASFEGYIKSLPAQRQASARSTLNDLRPLMNADGTPNTKRIRTLVFRQGNSQYADDVFNPYALAFILSGFNNVPESLSHFVNSSGDLHPGVAERFRWWLEPTEPEILEFDRWYDTRLRSELRSDTKNRIPLQPRSKWLQLAAWVRLLLVPLTIFSGCSVGHSWRDQLFFTLNQTFGTLSAALDELEKSGYQTINVHGREIKILDRGFPDEPWTRLTSDELAELQHTLAAHPPAFSEALKRIGLVPFRYQSRYLGLANNEGFIMTVSDNDPLSEGARFISDVTYHNKPIRPDSNARVVTPDLSGTVTHEAEHVFESNQPRAERDYWEDLFTRSEGEPQYFASAFGMNPGEDRAEIAREWTRGSRQLLLTAAQSAVEGKSVFLEKVLALCAHRLMNEGRTLRAFGDVSGVLVRPEDWSVTYLPGESVSLESNSASVIFYLDGDTNEVTGFEHVEKVFEGKPIVIEAGNFNEPFTSPFIKMLSPTVPRMKVANRSELRKFIRIDQLPINNTTSPQHVFSNLDASRAFGAHNPFNRLEQLAASFRPHNQAANQPAVVKETDAIVLMPHAIEDLGPAAVEYGKAVSSGQPMILKITSRDEIPALLKLLSPSLQKRVQFAISRNDVVNILRDLKLEGVHVLAIESKDEFDAALLKQMIADQNLNFSSFLVENSQLFLERFLISEQFISEWRALYQIARYA